VVSNKRLLQLIYEQDLRSLSLSAWRHWICGLWHHVLWQTGTFGLHLQDRGWRWKIPPKCL